jgi:hypothetical protein
MVRLYLGGMISPPRMIRPNSFLQGPDGPGQLHTLVLGADARIIRGADALLVRPSKGPKWATFCWGGGGCSFHPGGMVFPSGPPKPPGGQPSVAGRILRSSRGADGISVRPPQSLKWATFYCGAGGDFVRGADTDTIRPPDLLRFPALGGGGYDPAPPSRMIRGISEKCP